MNGNNSVASSEGSSDEDQDLAAAFENMYADSDCYLTARGPEVEISESEVMAAFIDTALATEIYEIVNGVHRVFSHFNIPYWITGGSLIGQVRHGGIIPWDDDADICCFMEDKERIFSPEVQQAFKLNDLYVIEDQTYDIVNGLLSKVYRNEVPSKAKKNGRVPYPFCDIFWQNDPTEKNEIIFCDYVHYRHRIYIHELYPLKLVNFGPIEVMAPADPLPQLERGYHSSWAERGELHNVDHIQKQGLGGPRRAFDMSPFKGKCAEWDASAFNPKVILHKDADGA